MLEVKSHRMRNYDEVCIEPELKNYTDTHEGNNNNNDHFQQQQNSPEYASLKETAHWPEPGSNVDLPDEIGFHISVDVHDMDELSHEQKEPSPPNFDARNYAETQDMTDEAMGYLTGATYRHYREMDEMGEKVGLSRSSAQNTTEFDESPLYGNMPLLETALEYDPLEGIEGEVIEEIDYQNVTIVHTKLAHSMHSSSNDLDGDYVSVESFDEDQTTGTGGDSNAFEMNGARFSPRALHASSQHAIQEKNATSLSAYPDAASLKSNMSYENFDPTHCQTDQYTPGTHQAAHGIEQNAHKCHTEAHSKDASYYSEALLEDNDIYVNVTSQSLVPDDDYI